jgi:hypothetical protein
LKNYYISPHRENILTNKITTPKKVIDNPAGSMYKTNMGIVATNIWLITAVIPATPNMDSPNAYNKNPTTSVSNTIFSFI